MSASIPVSSASPKAIWAFRLSRSDETADNCAERSLIRAMLTASSDSIGPPGDRGVDQSGGDLCLPLCRLGLLLRFPDGLGARVVADDRHTEGEGREDGKKGQGAQRTHENPWSVMKRPGHEKCGSGVG